MTWQDALEIVINQSKGNGQYGHDKYRELTADSHPDHIIWRSRIVSKVTGIKEEIKIKENKQLSNQKVVISTGNGGITSIPTSESVQVMKEMRACPYYEKTSNCGCGKSLCRLGKGQPDIRKEGYGLVTFFDCAHCLRPEVEMYALNAYKKSS